MQIRINKFTALLIACFVAALLFIAGCETKPASNNAAVSSNNQNTTNTNTNGEEQPLIMAPLCENLNTQKIKGMIKREFPSIRDQFKFVNSTTGTANLTFTTATLPTNPTTTIRILTLIGSITSDQEEFAYFLRRIHSLRDRSCINQVIFQGEGNKNFEWTIQSNEQPAACNLDINAAIGSSGLTQQFNAGKFTAVYDPANKTLKMSRMMEDDYDDSEVNNDHLIRLFTYIRKNVASGCIKKIIFGNKQPGGGTPTPTPSTPTPNTNVNTNSTLPITDDPSFNWGVCQGIDVVECNGACRPKEECVKVDKNANTSNTNAK